MTHTSGLTYGTSDPTTVLAKAYGKAALRHPGPRPDIAGVLMTQRYYGQGGLHTIAFRNEAYKALGC